MQNHTALDARFTRAVAALPALHNDLGLVLAVQDRTGLTLRQAALDARTAITGALERVAAHARNELGLDTLPTAPSLAETARWLIRSACGPLTASEDGLLIVTTLEARAREARGVAYAVRHRGVRLGPCPLPPALGEGEPPREACDGLVIFETCAPGEVPEPGAWCTRCKARLPLGRWRAEGLEPSWGEGPEGEALAAAALETGEVFTPRALRAWRTQGEVAWRMVGAGQTRRAIYAMGSVVARAQVAAAATRAEKVRAAVRVAREDRLAALLAAAGPVGRGPAGVALMEAVAVLEGEALEVRVLGVLGLGRRPCTGV